MFNTPTTKTEIAKWAVQAVVSAKVSSFTSDQLVERTDLDEDSIAVDIGSSVVGYVVASKLRPVTDAAVDTVVERYQSWRKSKNETSNNDE